MFGCSRKDNFILLIFEIIQHRLQKNYEEIFICLNVTERVNYMMERGIENDTY